MLGPGPLGQPSLILVTGLTTLPTAITDIVLIVLSFLDSGVSRICIDMAGTPAIFNVINHAIK